MRGFTARLGSARLGSARLGQSVAPYSHHVKPHRVNFTGKLPPKRGYIMPFLRLFCISERRGFRIEPLRESASAKLRYSGALSADSQADDP